MDALTFPPDGRSARCAKCKNVWHAIAYEPEPDVLPPVPETQAQQAGAKKAGAGTDVAGQDGKPFAESEKTGQPAKSGAESLGAQIVDDGTGGSHEPDEGDIEHAAEARARIAANHAGKKAKIRYKGGGARGIEAFALGAFLAIFIAAMHYRDDVVRALPSTAGLYATVGIPVNLRGLEFDNVTQRRDFENGVPVLIIEGEIINVRDRATPVPALRFALRGKSGDELYAWTLEPRQRAVDPEAAMNFRTRLASPPRGANDIQVRFIERDRRIVEYNQ